MITPYRCWRPLGLSLLLLCLLDACGSTAGDLNIVCTAYDEATERLAELGDTVLINADARVQADLICDER